MTRSPTTGHHDATVASRDQALALYELTRRATEELASRLSPEDQQLQSMPDASPTKWHRAHTTWFFETFILEPAGIPPFDARYAFLYNSYYEAVGPRHGRPKRGLLSRPSAVDVGTYRRSVDESVTKLLRRADAATLERVLPVLELGVAHEEQHQELLLTDILHAFSENPLEPAYRDDTRDAAPAEVSRRSAGPEPRFEAFQGGLCSIGAPAEEPRASNQVFVFDNERPRHKEWIAPFAISDRLVTVRELKAFVREGGYATPSLWLSEGFDFVRAGDIRAPLYSRIEGDDLHVFTLGGPRVAADDEPVVHVSYYEADALARFLGARLPTEAEWELAASKSAVRGNFAEDGWLRPRPAAPTAAGGLHQLFGDAWEWTRSSYEAYPGYAPPAGALGEYNGKFMVSQRVLRGGSCLTPRRHMRASYRNFWPPGTRFQMAGLRLARDLSS